VLAFRIDERSLRFDSDVGELHLYNLAGPSCAEWGPHWHEWYQRWIGVWLPPEKQTTAPVLTFRPDSQLPASFEIRLIVVASDSPAWPVWAERRWHPEHGLSFHLNCRETQAPAAAWEKAREAMARLDPASDKRGRPPGGVVTADEIAARCWQLFSSGEQPTQERVAESFGLGLTTIKRAWRRTGRRWPTKTDQIRETGELMALSGLLIARGEAQNGSEGRYDHELQTLPGHIIQ
jgi:hypothetical protein